MTSSRLPPKAVRSFRMAVVSELSLAPSGVTDSRTGQPGVLITVADTGHGVEAHLKTNLFDAFRSTKGINGSGLGLWISKGIIEKHRGSIRFRSSTKPGSSGTVFLVFIPDERSPTV
jgi:signal transduction histidine kinase